MGVWISLMAVIYYNYSNNTIYCYAMANIISMLIMVESVIIAGLCQFN